MSKQSKAKEEQGYVAKAVPETCMMCSEFRSDKKDITNPYGTRTSETNMRCGIGGFAVKKMGTCKLWEGKVTV